jgi:hypothetical protein
MMYRYVVMGRNVISSNAIEIQLLVRGESDELELRKKVTLHSRQLSQ